MRGSLLGAAIVLFALSFTCIGFTTVEVALGRFGMGAGEFWGAVAFHVVGALAAALMLDRANAVKPQTQEEVTS